MYKILYVNGSSNIGGAEVSLFNLVKRLDKKQFTPIVALPSAGLLFDKLKTLEINIETLLLREFSRKKIFAFLFSTLKLANLIKKEKIDLVHANSIYIAEQSYFAAKLAGVPCICHVRDLAPVLGAGMLRSAAFKNAKKIIAISEAVKKDLIEKLYVPENKITRIYNGVDTEEFSPDICPDKFRGELNLGSKKLIGMVGRFSPEKGQEIFLRAAAEVLKVYGDVKFVIVGDAKLGSEKFKTEMAALSKKLNLNDKVIFTGFRDDLPQILRSLDILVVPSRAEPFGRVIIEAFACSIPVIATDSGAAAEIISKESGILIKPDNVSELKQAIIELLKNPEQSKLMGRKGRDLVLERFSIIKHVSQIEELYREILHKDYR